jgi:protoheme IX farnesyltransferase
MKALTTERVMTPAPFDAALPAGSALAGNGTAADYFALLKPRVMALVVFTAFAGLLVAPKPMHPWMGFMALLAIALGAGAAGALNMWFDADIDALMKRTAKRPLPRGAIQPGEALGFGLSLAIASVLTLGLIANYLAAALLAFTIFFYVVVYTMWLKRWTAQNIVIGGAAGALPPLIASTAATGTLDVPAISLFLIIFLWTPPHFWALALLRADDYARANVPMLPVTAGEGETRRQILIYSLLLVLSSFAPLLLGIAGWIYLTASLVLGVLFLERAWHTFRYRQGERARKSAALLFGFSILYLSAIFAALVVEHLFALPLFPSLIG